MQAYSLETKNIEQFCCIVFVTFCFVLWLWCVSALCSVQGVVELLDVFPDHRVNAAKNKQKQIQVWGAMTAMPGDGLGMS